MDLLTPVSATRLRAARFLGVTVVTAGLGQVLILFFFAGLSWPALMANAVAVIFVAIAGFTLSLKYVWTDSDPSARTLQISVFVAMSVLGLVISSITVRMITTQWDHFLSANVGSFLGYGIAWALRFAVLDRFVFRDVHL